MNVYEKQVRILLRVLALIIRRTRDRRIMLAPARFSCYAKKSAYLNPGGRHHAPSSPSFVRRLKRLALVYFTEILGFCVMDNHFHILLRMFPADYVSETNLAQRYRVRYGEKRVFPASKSDELRQKWSSLSEFSKELN